MPAKDCNTWDPIICAPKKGGQKGTHDAHAERLQVVCTDPHGGAARLQVLSTARRELTETKLLLKRGSMHEELWSSPELGI